MTRATAGLEYDRAHGGNSGFVMALETVMNLCGFCMLLAASELRGDCPSKQASGIKESKQASGIKGSKQASGIKGIRLTLESSDMGLGRQEAPLVLIVRVS